MRMTYFQIEKDDGLFRTFLPAFDCNQWQDVLYLGGFVWIHNPRIDLSGKLDALVADGLFPSDKVDARCSIARLELDVSLPTNDFLRHVAAAFRHDQSRGQQPTNLSSG